MIRVVHAAPSPAPAHARVARAAIRSAGHPLEEVAAADPLAGLALALEGEGAFLYLHADAVGPLGPLPDPEEGPWALLQDGDGAPFPAALAIPAELAERLRGLSPGALHRALRAVPWRVAIAPDALRSPRPAEVEADAILAATPPVIPAALVLGDPVRLEADGVDPSRVLAAIAGAAPALAEALGEDAARLLPPRAAQLVHGDVAVLPHEPPARMPEGEVLAFLHCYYPDALPEMLAVIDRIPVPVRLHVSAADREGADAIAETLAERPAEVRVVAQNRGRDMAALFVTFADVLRESGDRPALRLHSKRSPQETAQASGAYVEHLHGNLVGSAGYVARLLMRLEDEPAIGLAIPPAPHHGRAMLGHGWLNNRAPLRDWMARLGIEGPLDPYTPLAPWGGMYWFRPNALASMLAHDWRHEDYAPEPHYRDGDLAHVQERLIPYAVRSAGYRVLTVMTPETAAQSHARLEMKLDAVAGRLASGDLRDQIAQLDRIGRGPRMRAYRRLASLYGAWTRRFPTARPALRRIAHPLRRWLGGGLGRR